MRQISGQMRQISGQMRQISGQMRHINNYAANCEDITIMVYDNNNDSLTPYCLNLLKVKMDVISIQR
jgi:hypothetical protein